MLDENSLRNYFADVNNKDELTVAELTSGTVTHYTGFVYCFFDSSFCLDVTRYEYHLSFLSD